MALTFGEKIKEARKSQNLTQKKLAEAIGAKHNSISDWENDKNKPDPDTIELLCGVLKITPNYLLKSSNEDFSPKEKQVIEKYRSLDTYGKETVEMILDRESARIIELQKQRERITELESHSAAIIELPARTSGRHLAEYFHDASAGSGIFILGNETASQISIPDSDWDERTDYVIRVNGKSMEPDYMDGDNVMVSQHTELLHGDVGIFIINGKAYIKEYGETELISRNDANIPIHEFDNIVCMGKVIGKLEGEYEIINN